MSDETQKYVPERDGEKTQKIDLLQATKKDLNAGKIVFSRFELVRELGSGGMGVVWLAKDLEVEGHVALKFLPGLVRDPVAERDLRDEVKLARGLVHENIVNVNDLKKDDTSIAVQMEYVDGPTVRMLLRDTPNRFLDVDKAAPIVRGLCLAIDYAWTPPRRLVHRDIKPANMMVTPSGLVKVVDFGIAHTVAETITRLTGQSNSERVVGTLPYMSPQQLVGEVHHSSDVYSIGATIYEILTSTPPFRSSDVLTLTQQIKSDIPQTMAERRKQLIGEGRQISGAQPIPKVWEEVVASCLAKDSAKRPVSAREIARRLGLVEGGEPIQTRVWPKAFAAAVAVLATVGTGLYFTRSSWLPGGQASAPTRPENVQNIKPAEASLTPKPENAPVVPQPRQSWHLITNESVQVIVARESDGAVEFEGPLNAGEKRALPLDKTLLIQLKSGKGLGWEIDGRRLEAPPAPYGRWLVSVPTLSEQQPSVKVAPPPFETEIGPLVKNSGINQLEADWLRAALGGDKGDAERTLARQLFVNDTPITLGQWRARTALKFRPDRAALSATDPLQLARAIDLILLPGGAEVRLLRLEPGQFRRGSPPEEVGRRTSDPQVGPASVAKPFFIGVFEITQAQYESVLKRSPSYWRGNPSWPVDQVTWGDLTGNTGFLAKLNSDLTKTLGGMLVADLPTDDEWEYACRAGTTTSFNNGASITNLENDSALKNIAHYNKAGGGPRPAGSFDPNAWGLYDMHGNLQEWTQDRYVRGGSWQSKAAGCRASTRIQMSREASASNQTGFRLVLRFHEPKP